VNHAPRTANYTSQRRRGPYGPLPPCAGVTAAIGFSRPRAEYREAFLSAYLLYAVLPSTGWVVLISLA
jgi:hypothetical protein